MPTYDFICETCGKPGRAWREEGHPPRFCDRKCMSDCFSPQPRLRKWPVSPEMHEEIKGLYQTKVGTGGNVVRAYAEKIGYPRCKISRYAIQQGWIAKSSKVPDWTPEELHILERFAHLSMENIQRKLKQAGFSRSVTGILLKRKKLQLPANLRGYSARQVAGFFGVDVHGVVRWIDRGWLRAIKRGTKRSGKQGGDIYYIKSDDIKDFILSYISEIDLRKVDKYWFVGLLAGNGHKQRAGDASPCPGCRWEVTDKNICAPTCDKLHAWQREQARKMILDDDNKTVEMAAERILKVACG